MKEHFPKIVEAGIKLDPIDISHLSENGGKPPIDISNDVKTSPKAYSMKTSHRSSDHYNARYAQPACIGDLRHET